VTLVAGAHVCFNTSRFMSRSPITTRAPHAGHLAVADVAAGSGTGTAWYWRFS
jgi:hypothetical protein